MRHTTLLGILAGLSAIDMSVREAAVKSKDDGAGAGAGAGADVILLVMRRMRGSFASTTHNPLVL